MPATKITRIKILSFVPFQDVKDTAMMWILRRNEVKIDAEREISFSPFNTATENKLMQKDGVFADLVDEMYDFCNDNCKGIWSYTYTTKYEDIGDSAYFHGLYHEMMSGTMRVYFELREDRDMFMKNHILLAKLAQE